MAHKVEYNSETVRIKLLYGEQYNIEVVKLHLHHGFVSKQDISTGLKFLARQGINIDKRHPNRLTLEEINQYVGQVGEFEVVPGVWVAVVDDDTLDEITVKNVGLIDHEFILNDGINHLVDFMVAFYGYYNVK